MHNNISIHNTKLPLDEIHAISGVINDNIKQLDYEDEDVLQHDIYNIAIAVISKYLDPNIIDVNVRVIGDLTYVEIRRINNGNING